MELLVTDRPERAKELAQYIDGLNATRQTIERSIQLAAAKQAKELFDPVDDAALVLADRGWHPGVIGIVAGRLAERVPSAGRDDFVGQGGLAAGDRLGPQRARASTSMRPWPTCGEFLLAHGGHAAAAGLKIEEDQLDGFRGASAKWRPRESPPTSARPSCSSTSRPRSAPLRSKRRSRLERLAPFGHGNPPAAALHDRRNAQRPAQALGQQRASPGHDALAARRDAAGRGLRRRRLGRRPGRRSTARWTWPSAP